MGLEEIEKEAYRRYPIEDNNFELLQKSDIMWDGFCDGAEWMQKQKQAEIDELNNQLSVLTEQLDAVHVFYEGVKEHYIKKARKWLENEYFHGKLREIDGSWFVFEDDFIKAMKGE